MTILAVDDDCVDLDLFQEAITCVNPSIQCIVANNGIEALAIMDKIVPDIIFLDINMPKMDGLECLSLVKGNTDLNNIPVVMYSAAANQQAIDYISAQNVTYLKKQSSLNDAVKSLSAVIKTLFAVHA